MCFIDFKKCIPLFKDERWSSAFDPKLAGLLSELEQGLGSVVRRAGTEDSGKRSPGEDDILGGCTLLIT